MRPRTLLDGIREVLTSQRLEDVHCYLGLLQKGRPHAPFDTEGLGTAHVDIKSGHLSHDSSAYDIQPPRVHPATGPWPPSEPLGRYWCQFER